MGPAPSLQDTSSLLDSRAWKLSYARIYGPNWTEPRRSKKNKTLSRMNFWSAEELKGPVFLTEVQLFQRPICRFFGRLGSQSLAIRLQGATRQGKAAS